MILFQVMEGHSRRYDVGYRYPEEFTMAREMFEGARAEVGFQGPVALRITGPTTRIDMIIERLERDGLEPDDMSYDADEESGLSDLFVAVRLGNYHPESMRAGTHGGSADTFTIYALNPSENEQPIHVEASYLEGIKKIDI